jgi:hypothetical protein
MSLLDTASLIVTPNGVKEGKLYSVIPSDGSGDMSVVRATTATRVNSAGLVELVPYNLVGYSEQFDNAAWTTLNATITSNSITAPNGTMTGDTLTSTSTNTTAVFRFVLVTGTNTWSLYAKKGTGRYLEINTNSSGLIAAKFDLETGAIVGTPSVGANASIQNAGNGWYRCIITSATAIDRFSIFITNNTTTSNWDSSVGLSCYIWGAQLNEGTIKDYQKTETRLNIPRLDYSNGTCPSLLVEPQRTNLVTYSEQFDDASWSKVNSSVTANADISPDGYTNADRIYDNAASGQHRVGKNISVVSGTTYTFSVFAKKGSLRYCYLLTTAGVASDRYYFDLQDGVSITAGGKIEDYGSGWYRISAQVTAAATDNKLFAFNLTDSPSSPTYSGTGTGYHMIYGYQVEAGSYATSYIPTTSASVTRNADQISKTGISSLIGQTEGTLFVGIYDYNFTPDNASPYLEIYADANNRITIFKNTSNQYQIFIRTLGVTTLSILTASISGNSKIAIGYKENDLRGLCKRSSDWN